MSKEIKSPTFPESVQSGTIVQWHKQEGDSVALDELIVEIETEKVVLEVNSHCDGVIAKITKQENAEVASNEIIGYIEEQSGSAKVADTATKTTETVADDAEDGSLINPAAQKLIDQYKLNVNSINGTGKDGRILKSDVLDAIDKIEAIAKNVANSDLLNSSSAPVSNSQISNRQASNSTDTIIREKMSPIRKRISARLLESKQNTAMLTTFNEVDMSAIINIRKKHQEEFKKNNGIKLGFMSFFLKASALAAKKFPIVTAQIDGNDIVYNQSCNISVAVSTEKGLVVPVLKNVQAMSLADIERAIVAISKTANAGTMGIDAMQGGTFTITNGGIFGSMLSTPIINAPQSAILGMHNIVQRPVAVDGQVVIRPIMYLALSYDHRLIDGSDAVQFLVATKNSLEDPINLILN